MSEDVELMINGKMWAEFSSISIGLHIDAPATISFVAPWDPSREDMRAAFRPYMYQELAVKVGRDEIFSGNLITPAPSSDSKQASITATGYATCGRIQDCKIPASAYPLEFSKQKLDVIARKICTAMGLDIEIIAKATGAAFERAVLKPCDDPWAFLTGLAKQRNLLLSSNASGALTILSVVDSPAVATFERGAPPLVSCEAKFDGQKYHSEYTAIGSTKAGVKGGKNTVKNPRLTTIQRCDVFEADESEKGDLPKAAAARFGRVLAGAAVWQLKVPTWRDELDDLFIPGTFAYVTDPHSMIFEKTKLLVSRVQLDQDSKGESAILDVVVKESFTDQEPEAFPWA